MTYGRKVEPQKYKRLGELREAILLRLTEFEKEINELFDKFVEYDTVEKDVETQENAINELLDCSIWRESSFSDDCEIAPAELCPNLVNLLKANGGKLTLQSYKLYLSKNKKWIKRFRRG